MNPTVLFLKPQLRIAVVHSALAVSVQAAKPSELKTPRSDEKPRARAA